jgi:hypothetical protein
MAYGDFELHIDEGWIWRHGEPDTFTMESSGIIIGDQFYSYSDVVFFIQNGIVQCRGEIFTLGQFRMYANRARLVSIESRQLHRIEILDNILWSSHVRLIDWDIDPEQRAYIANTTTRRHATAPIQPSTPQDGGYLKRLSENPQNVHDTSLLDSCCSALGYVEKYMRVKASELSDAIVAFTIRQIREEIAKETTAQRTARSALRVVEYMIAQSAYITRFDACETNILVLVWMFHNKLSEEYTDVMGLNGKQVNHMQHSTWDSTRETCRAEMRRLILLNLEDCIERDIVVCATGRSTRVINSIDAMRQIYTTQSSTGDSNDTKQTAGSVNPISSSTLQTLMLNKASVLSREWEEQRDQPTDDKRKKDISVKLVDEFSPYVRDTESLSQIIQSWGEDW